MKNKNCTIIIPARMGSSRLPNKPLKQIAGKPLLKWVVELAQNVNFKASLIILTEDKIIKEYIESIGVECFLTDKLHKNGTARILEILERWGSKSFFLIFRCCKCFFLITALRSASFLRRIILSNKINLTPTRNFDAAWRHLARVRLTQLGTTNSNITIIMPSKPFRCLPTGRCLRCECKSISRKIRDHRITTTKYITFIHNSMDVKTMGTVPLAAISWK